MLINLTAMKKKCSYCFIMEATVLNTAQHNILRMLSFVKDEQTVSDVEKMLKNSEGLCVKDLIISALCYRTAQFGKILGA